MSETPKRRPLTPFTTNMDLPAKRATVAPHLRKPIMANAVRQPSFPARFQPDPNAPPEQWTALTTSDLRRLQSKRATERAALERKVARVVQAPETPATPQAQAEKRKPGRPKKGIEAK